MAAVTVRRFVEYNWLPLGAGPLRYTMVNPGQVRESDARLTVTAARTHTFATKTKTSGLKATRPRGVL